VTKNKEEIKNIPKRGR